MCGPYVTPLGNVVHSQVGVGIDEARIDRVARQVPDSGPRGGLQVPSHLLDEPVADHHGGVVQDAARSRHHPRTHQCVEPGAVVPHALNRFGTVRLLGSHAAGEQEREAQHGEICSHGVPQGE